MIIDLIGEGDPQKIVQKFKLDDTNKWYMYNPESLLENDTLQILWVLRCKQTV